MRIDYILATNRKKVSFVSTRGSNYDQDFPHNSSSPITCQTLDRRNTYFSEHSNWLWNTYRWNLKTHCSHFHTLLYLQWHRSREHPCVDPPGNIHPDFLMSACPSHTKHKMYFSDSGLLRILRLIKQSTKFSHFVLTAVNFPQTLGLSRYSRGIRPEPVRKVID